PPSLGPPATKEHDALCQPSRFIGHGHLHPLPARPITASRCEGSFRGRTTTGTAIQKTSHDQCELSVVTSGQFGPECVPTPEFVTSSWRELRVQPQALYPSD